MKTTNELELQTLKDMQEIVEVIKTVRQMCDVLHSRIQLIELRLTSLEERSTRIESQTDVKF